MSSYTMQLKTYIEMWSQDQELPTRDRIENGRTKLFDFDYPIFDENYRKDFETKFIRNFYTREIGFETEGLFKFQLESWLLIHMPYFNKLFESELINYDPLKNSQTDVTHTKTTDRLKTDTRVTDGTNNTDIIQNTVSSQDTTNNATVTDDNFDRNLQSNTPDGRLNLTTNDGEGVIEYANEITEHNQNNSSTSNSTSGIDSTNDVTGSNDSTTHVDDTLTSDDNETEDFVQSRQGKIGVQTYAKMIQEHRQAFLRIEKQIFDEMQQLFMLVY